MKVALNAVVYKLVFGKNIKSDNMKYFVLLVCLSSVIDKNVLSGYNGLQLPRVLQDPQKVKSGVAQPSQFPWQVCVVKFVSFNELNVCNGAILSENWVLTTAFCLDRAQFIVIEAGSPDLETDIVYLLAHYTILHENFSPYTLENDIGLIYLSKALTFNDKISAIALPQQELAPGTVGTIISWRIPDFGDNSDIHPLLYTNGTTVDNSICAQTYPFTFVPDMVCVTHNDENIPCLAYVGATLVVDDGGEAVLAASLSILEGSDCRNFPAIFTRTAYYREWIRDKTGI